MNLTDPRLVTHLRPPFRPCSRALGVCLLVVVAASAGPGCTAGDAPGGADADRPLLIGTLSTFEGFNEYIVQGSGFNAAVLRQMFLWLADESLDPAHVEPTFTPRLASSWSFSEDRRALTFVLRDDVTWSDGTPVTATDVRFTWEAQTSPEVAWPYADIKENIADVEVVSDHEVTFRFHQPSANSLINAVEGGILPAHAWSELPFDRWRQEPRWFADRLVTNGPYVLETWEPRRRLVLSARPGFHEEGIPRLPRVVFVHIEEPQSRLSQLLSGDIDVLYGVNPADAERLRDDPELELLAYPSRNFTFVFWNTLRPQFDDARVRRALAHAVDRQEIVETLWGDLAHLHNSMVSSWHWAHADLEPLAYDPAAARRLLDEAGWSTGADGLRSRDGVEFSFELTTNPGNPERWDAMRMIADDLGQVGIAVTNREIEFQQLSALNFAHDFDATVTAMQMDTSLELGYALHTESIDAGYNFGSFRSEEADRRIEAIRELTDIRDAGEHVAAIEEILRDEQPFLFLWEADQLLAARRDVEVVTNIIGPFYDLHLWSRAPGP